MNMFSNISSTNLDKNPRPESYMSDRLTNLKPQQVETINNPRVSEEVTDLINLLDDISVSQPSYNKQSKINDLQINELEKFLTTTTGTSTLKESQIFKTVQDKEFQSFLDKYDINEKSNTVTNKNGIENKETHSSGSCMHRSSSKVLPVFDQRHIDKHFKVNEDLTDEILFKNTLNENNPYNYLNKEKLHVAKNNFPTPLSIQKHPVERSNIMDLIVSSNNITHTTLKVKDNNEKIANNILFTKKETPKQHSNAKIEELVSKYNLKYLEAIKMDEKLFLKHNLLISEAEKKHMTLGPTLHDKSMVLPNIMKRLAEKKKSLDEHTNVNRKPVLDTSAHQYKPEDYELLHFDYTAKTFNVTENTNFQSRIIQAAPVATTKSDKTSTSDFTLKNNQTPKNSASGSKNNQSFADRNSRFIHIDELKAIRDKFLAGKVQDTGSIDPRVLKPPQLLMADCNKARFVANATSQLLKDFVCKK